MNSEPITLDFLRSLVEPSKPEKESKAFKKGLKYFNKLVRKSFKPRRRVFRDYKGRKIKPITYSLFGLTVVPADKTPKWVVKRTIRRFKKAKYQARLIDSKNRLTVRAIV
jgi:hypothetical protein